jgi:transposase
MPHITGDDRSQALLLPESLDDYVGADSPVRFIEAFVDGLDLAAAGFARVQAKPTGRPGYQPADLLKLYIYGYLNRVRSSRRLEAADSDEAGRLFQSEVGHVFQLDRGHPTDLIPAG